MNWYKLSSPIQGPIHDWGYLDVGHDKGYRKEEKDVFLYFIDMDLKIHKTSEHNEHSVWPENIGHSRLGTGRYDPNNNVCSLALSYYYDKLPPTRKEYVLEQMEKILDKTFNNPTIKRFR